MKQLRIFFIIACALCQTIISMQENIQPITGDSSTTAKLRAWYKANENKNFQQPLEALVWGHTRIDHGIVPPHEELKAMKEWELFSGYSKYTSGHHLFGQSAKALAAYFGELLNRRLILEAQQRLMHPLKK